MITTGNMIRRKSTTTNASLPPLLPLLAINTSSAKNARRNERNAIATTLGQKFCSNKKGAGQPVSFFYL
jgi:hypothetical protein